MTDMTTVELTPEELAKLANGCAEPKVRSAASCG